MVENTGATPGAGALRPLNKPRPISIEVNEAGQPVTIGDGRRRWLISTVTQQWRVEDEWWRQQPVRRMYYECVLEDGRRLTVFQDLVTDRWYDQAG
ncbi:MAG: hypothetical protein ACE5IG_02720 [Dehalococcoidia bacterium]